METNLSLFEYYVFRPETPGSVFGFLIFVFILFNIVYFYTFYNYDIDFFSNIIYVGLNAEFVNPLYVSKILNFKYEDIPSNFINSTINRIPAINYLNPIYNHYILYSLSSIYKLYNLEPSFFIKYNLIFYNYVLSFFNYFGRFFYIGYLFTDLSLFYGFSISSGIIIFINIFWVSLFFLYLTVIFLDIELQDFKTENVRKIFKVIVYFIIFSLLFSWSYADIVLISLYNFIISLANIILKSYYDYLDINYPLAFTIKQYFTTIIYSDKIPFDLFFIFSVFRFVYRLLNNLSFNFSLFLIIICRSFISLIIKILIELERKYNILIFNIIFLNIIFFFLFVIYGRIFIPIIFISDFILSLFIIPGIIYKIIPLHGENIYDYLKNNIPIFYIKFIFNFLTLNNDYEVTSINFNLFKVLYFSIIEYIYHIFLALEFYLINLSFISSFSVYYLRLLNIFISNCFFNSFTDMQMLMGIYDSSSKSFLKNAHQEYMVFMSKFIPLYRYLYSIFRTINFPLYFRPYYICDSFISIIPFLFYCFIYYFLFYDIKQTVLNLNVYISKSISVLTDTVYTDYSKNKEKTESPINTNFHSFFLFCTVSILSLNALLSYDEDLFNNFLNFIPGLETSTNSSILYTGITFFFNFFYNSSWISLILILIIISLDFFKFSTNLGKPIGTPQTTAYYAISYIVWFIYVLTDIFYESNIFSFTDIIKYFFLILYDSITFILFIIINIFSKTEGFESITFNSLYEKLSEIGLITILVMMLKLVVKYIYYSSIIPTMLGLFIVNFFLNYYSVTFIILAFASLIPTFFILSYIINFKIFQTVNFNPNQKSNDLLNYINHMYTESNAYYCYFSVPYFIYNILYFILYCVTFFLIAFCKKLASSEKYSFYRSGGIFFTIMVIYLFLNIYSINKTFVYSLYYRTILANKQFHDILFAFHYNNSTINTVLNYISFFFSNIFIYMNEGMVVFVISYFISILSYTLQDLKTYKRILLLFLGLFNNPKDIKLVTDFIKAIEKTDTGILNALAKAFNSDLKYFKPYLYLNPVLILEPIIYIFSTIYESIVNPYSIIKFLDISSEYTIFSFLKKEVNFLGNYVISENSLSKFYNISFYYILVAYLLIYIFFKIILLIFSVIILPFYYEVINFSRIISKEQITGKEITKKYFVETKYYNYCIVSIKHIISSVLLIFQNNFEFIYFLKNIYDHFLLVGVFIFCEWNHLRYSYNRVVIKQYKAINIIYEHNQVLIQKLLPTIKFFLKSSSLNIIFNVLFIIIPFIFEESLENSFIETPTSLTYCTQSFFEYIIKFYIYIESYCYKLYYGIKYYSSEEDTETNIFLETKNPLTVESINTKQYFILENYLNGKEVIKVKEHISKYYKKTEILNIKTISAQHKDKIELVKKIYIMIFNIFINSKMTDFIFMLTTHSHKMYMMAYILSIFRFFLFLNILSIFFKTLIKICVLLLSLPVFNINNLLFYFFKTGIPIENFGFYKTIAVSKYIFYDTLILNPFIYFVKYIIYKIISFTTIFKYLDLYKKRMSNKENWSANIINSLKLKLYSYSAISEIFSIIFNINIQESNFKLVYKFIIYYTYLLNSFSGYLCNIFIYFAYILFIEYIPWSPHFLHYNFVLFILYGIIILIIKIIEDNLNQFSLYRLYHEMSQIIKICNLVFEKMIESITKSPEYIFIEKNVIENIKKIYTYIINFFKGGDSVSYFRKYEKVILGTVKNVYYNFTKPSYNNYNITEITLKNIGTTNTLEDFLKDVTFKNPKILLIKANSFNRDVIISDFVDFEEYESKKISDKESKISYCKILKYIDYFEKENLRIILKSSNTNKFFEKDSEKIKFYNSRINYKSALSEEYYEKYNSIVKKIPKNIIESYEFYSKVMDLEKISEEYIDEILFISIFRNNDVKYDKLNLSDDTYLEKLHKDLLKNKKFVKNFSENILELFITKCIDLNKKDFLKICKKIISLKYFFKSISLRKILLFLKIINFKAELLHRNELFISEKNILLDEILTALNNFIEDYCIEYISDNSLDSENLVYYPRYLEILFCVFLEYYEKTILLENNLDINTGTIKVLSNISNLLVYDLESKAFELYINNQSNSENTLESLKSSLFDTTKEYYNIKLLDETKIIIKNLFRSFPYSAINVNTIFFDVNPNNKLNIYSTKSNLDLELYFKIITDSTILLINKLYLKTVKISQLQALLKNDSISLLARIKALNTKVKNSSIFSNTIYYKFLTITEDLEKFVNIDELLNLNVEKLKNYKIIKHKFKEAKNYKQIILNINDLSFSEGKLKNNIEVTVIMVLKCIRLLNIFWWDLYFDAYKQERKMEYNSYYFYSAISLRSELFFANIISFFIESVDLIFKIISYNKTLDSVFKKYYCKLLFHKLKIYYSQISMLQKYIVGKNEYSAAVRDFARLLNSIVIFNTRVRKIVMENYKNVKIEIIEDDVEEYNYGNSVLEYFERMHVEKSKYSSDKKFKYGSDLSKILNSEEENIEFLKKDVLKLIKS